MGVRHAPGILLASPTLGDPNFSKTLVLLFHHDENGATGLVVNRPTDQRLGELLDNLGATPVDAAFRRARIHLGGPVAEGIGWVVYEGNEGLDESFHVEADLRVSGSRSVLDKLLRRGHAGRFLFLLGYAGWAPGQLETEIEMGAWVPLPVDRRLLFEVPAANRWQLAYQGLGIDPSSWFGSLGNG